MRFQLKLDYRIKLQASCNIRVNVAFEETGFYNIDTGQKVD